jgi:hypothetical protein
VYLSPQQRSLRASIVGHAQKAKYDSRELTKNARAASPGSLGYWEREVDPDGQLDPSERARRAQHLLRAHMQRLALASSKARAQRSAS